MQHTVEGCLVKYNVPWFNGTIIKPGAFDKYDVKEIPIWCDFDHKGKIVGYATLKYEEDGVYYTGVINDSEESDEIIQHVLDLDLDLGMYAYHIKMKGHDVTSAELLGMAFAQIPDGAACISKIDGKQVIPDTSLTGRVLRPLRSKLAEVKADGLDVIMCSTEIIENAIAIMEKQEAKPAVHEHEEYAEHDWEREEDGTIDDFAMEYEFHNGPMCKRCYYSFCVHCDPDGWNKKPCVIDRYKCPSCGSGIVKGTLFCSKCGQAVKWNEERK